MPRLVVPLLALGLTLGACKEEAPTLDSGIDGSKQGDQLTPDEQTRLCEASQAYRAQLMSEDELRNASCTLVGITAALLAGGSADACELFRKDCVANPPEEMPGEPTMCSLGVDWSNCKATVAEIEACYEENGESYAAVMRSLSCAKIAEYESTPPNTEPELGTDCSLAKAKCATVLGGASGGEDVPNQ